MTGVRHFRAGHFGVKWTSTRHADNHQQPGQRPDAARWMIFPDGNGAQIRPSSGTSATPTACTFMVITYVSQPLNRKTRHRTPAKLGDYVRQEINTLQQRQQRDFVQKPLMLTVAGDAKPASISRPCSCMGWMRQISESLHLLHLVKLGTRLKKRPVVFPRRFSHHEYQGKRRCHSAVAERPATHNSR